MKAVTYYSYDDIRVENRYVPTIADNELLVKVHGCGLCGSDILKIVQQVSPPVSLGHELTGTIVACGQNVTNFTAGQRVVVAHHVPCGDCHYCRHGNHSMCASFKTSNIDPCGFAEYIRVPAQHVQQTTLLLPQTLTDEEGSFVEPLACCVRAVKRTPLLPGDTIVILGLGSIGLLMLQAFKALAPITPFTGGYLGQIRKPVRASARTGATQGSSPHVPTTPAPTGDGLPWLNPPHLSNTEIAEMRSRNIVGANPCGRPDGGSGRADDGHPVVGSDGDRADDGHPAAGSDGDRPGGGRTGEERDSIHIYGVDLIPERLEMARELGADDAFLAPAADQELRQLLAPFTANRGADAIIITATGSRPFQQAATAVRKGGMIHIFAAHSATVPINLETIYQQELTITSTYSSSPEDLRIALALLESRQVRVDGLISHRLPLDQFAEGVALMQKHAALKVYFQIAGES